MASRIPRGTWITLASACLAAVVHVPATRGADRHAQRPCTEHDEGKDGLCGHALRAIARFERERTLPAAAREAQNETDVTHCFLDLEIDLAAQTVAGANTLDVTSLTNGLTQFPLDLRSHYYTNSHSADLGPDPGYVPYNGGTRGMSARETEAKRGSRNALNYDGGNGGRTVTEPVVWLCDYWMGRYYGFVAPDAAGK